MRADGVRLELYGEFRRDANNPARRRLGMRFWQPPAGSIFGRGRGPNARGGGGRQGQRGAHQTEMHRPAVGLGALSETPSATKYANQFLYREINGLPV